MTTDADPPRSSGAGLLEGRVAFITGGARGIGLAIARRFVEQGARVGLADVDRDAALAAAEDLGTVREGSALAVEADVASESTLREAVEGVRQHFGQIDISVVNAGILALRPTVEMDLATWQRVIDVNLTGAFLTAKVCAAAIVEQGRGGRVIFTGSLMAQRGAAENCAYSASKFGVLGLMQTLAIELAPHGITVNAVNPGQIQTDMLDQLFADRAQLRGIQPDELRAQTLQHIALGRLGQPSEVADAYVFLASELSAYVTGQSISVEGGWALL